MILRLTDDDGTLLESWNVEEEFGDPSRPLARVHMANTIAAEIRRCKAMKRTENPAAGK